MQPRVQHQPSVEPASPAATTNVQVQEVICYITLLHSTLRDLHFMQECMLPICVFLRLSARSGMLLQLLTLLTVRHLRYLYALWHVYFGYTQPAARAEEPTMSATAGDKRDDNEIVDRDDCMCHTSGGEDSDGIVGQLV